MQSEPRNARISVWALAISLAATLALDFSFSSSGYLDVSVHRVPHHSLWIGLWLTGVCPAGFPHSDICGSMCICHSPQLFAAYHVFLRLLVPRHPPCALFAFFFLWFFLGCLVTTFTTNICFAVACKRRLVIRNLSSSMTPYDIFRYQYLVFKVRCFFSALLVRFKRPSVFFITGFRPTNRKIFVCSHINASHPNLFAWHFSMPTWRW